MLRLHLVPLAALLVVGCSRPHPARSPENVAACARAEDGLWCSRWTPSGFTPATRWSQDFGWGTAVAGDDDTVLTPDLDGDGQSDVCLRQATGLICALRATPESFGATLYPGHFADR